MRPAQFWQVALLIVVFGGSTLVGLSQPARPEAPPVTVALSSEAEWNLYLAAETVDLGAPMVLHFRFTNTRDEAQQFTYAYTVTDYWGREINAGQSGTITVRAKGEALDKRLFRPKWCGAYDVAATVAAKPAGSPPSAPAAMSEAQATIGIVPGPQPGLRPESFFASNTGDKGHNEFCRRIGLKVFRQHWADEWQCLADESRRERPAEAPLVFDFTRQDEYYRLARASDLSILGIVGYANPDWARTAEARELGMYGPPRDFDEFLRATIPCVGHYRDIRYWEFWNEPWIYGWTWAAPGSEYRRLQKMWCEAAKRARPDIRIIVGHSASFLVDHIQPDPSCYQGLVDATSNHPYKEGGEPSWRRGSQLRYTDYGVQEGERMGLHQHFLTENGTEVPGERDHPLNAAKIPPLHALGAMAGIYQANVQEGIGWGTDQMKGAVAYGVMTHFLEDRALLADVWPAHPLIWGGIFGNPKLADNTVERAEVIDARWGVKGRDDDNAKVALLWCYTGPDDRHLDRQGTITITPAADLRGYSLMGEPKGARVGDAFTIALNQYPIYLVSEQLSLQDMLKAIREARMEHVTPVNLSMFSFTRPVAEAPPLVVRVQNQLNRPVTGALRVKLPIGWEAQTNPVSFALGPAEIAAVEVPLSKTVANEFNQYPITVVAETDAGKTFRTQIVSAAYATRRKVTVDGSLDDWQGAVGAAIDSNQLASLEDYTYYLLHPNQPRPEGPDASKHVLAKCYTAWDDDSFYVAFRVYEPGLSQQSNSDTANHILPWYSGDCIEFALGLNERAADDYHPPSDPYYWKGMFRDTDYQYLLMQGTDGPALIRLHRPGMPYRVPFQTEAIEGCGPVPGARVAIKRNEGTKETLYECALPLAELDLLRPAERDAMRFGYIVCNDEGVGRLQWSEAAGVYDYWLNNGSFMPTWESFWACQTRWGILP